MASGDALVGRAELAKAPAVVNEQSLAIRCSVGADNEALTNCGRADDRRRRAAPLGADEFEDTGNMRVRRTVICLMDGGRRLGETATT